MKTKHILRLMITLTFSLFFLNNLQSQIAEKMLLVSKISKPEKVRHIANGTRLKIQTQTGAYIRARLQSVGKNYLLTQRQDTIYFNDIYSFRAQRKLNKAEFFTGVPVLIAGIAASVGGVPLSIILILMQEAGPGIFLVPLAGVVTTVAGIKLVGRSTYRMNKWRVFSEDHLESRNIL
ncbi:hypothetical protein [Maribellus maritimus]|uniref:hypothetical protein n=1 Tax=Maribellus maritimus TaxID=2870838 RepID=UPI001EEC613E|nr:hypothetical protein [Maribellus maritimus]MCG6186449.1 hypothetical protein [Maribellus maritimus]